MKKESGMGYLLLVLASFAGLGLDVLFVLLFMPMIFGTQAGNWTNAQHSINLILVSITWGIVSVLIVHAAKKIYGFDLFQKGTKMKAWQWALSLLIVIANLVITYLDWNGFKVIKEYNADGCLRFICQYIYYIFETILVSLIIIYAQKACDTWFKKTNIPFGGIILALTWGVAHMFTKDITEGIVCILSAFAFGCIYLLTNRDVRKAFPILFVAFIL